MWWMQTAKYSVVSRSRNHTHSRICNKNWIILNINYLKNRTKIDKWKRYYAYKFESTYKIKFRNELYKDKNEMFKNY